MIVAIIPARGGSRRIPKKNIKDFCGVPMLKRAIRTARACQMFNRIVVSTDDQEIADCAHLNGAVIHERSPNLAVDEVGTQSVVRRVLQDPELSDARYACCIYPCTPLLIPMYLQKAFECLQTNGKQYVFSIAKFGPSPHHALEQFVNGAVRPLSPRYVGITSDRLPATYYDAGQFYWGRADAFLEGADLYFSSFGYEIPSWRAIDINTPEDWRHAELLYRSLAAEDSNGR